MSEKSKTETTNENEKIVIGKTILLIIAIFCYLMSLFLPLALALIMGMPLDEQVDPEVINGIITVSAIFFGFSALRNGRNRTRHDFILLLIFFFQILVLVIATVSYFISYLRFSYSPLIAMVGTTTSLLVNLSSWLLIKILQV